MILKKCPMCKKEKTLEGFFAALATWHNKHHAKRSVYCKECHIAGLIPNGYGDPRFNGRYPSPEAT